MSSYQIEREQPDKNRISRFVDVLQHIDAIKVLSKQKLIELQNIIVDPRFKDIDYRYNQNYIGENINPYFQKIHYICPRPEDVACLMQGLLGSLDRMLAEDVHPIIIAAAISFGFVFIHPFEDGNGRIHRFLIHYVLSKTKFSPENIIFPISSVMLKDMNSYDAILELFSIPLMSMLTDYQMDEQGVMTLNQQTKSFYQYIDFTSNAEYLFYCIEKGIDEDIDQEIKFLYSYDKTKRAIQRVVDMPDHQIDLLIKCIIQNDGTLSSTKRNRFFSLLTDNEINELINIVNKIIMTKD